MLDGVVVVALPARPVDTVTAQVITHGVAHVPNHAEIDATLPRPVGAQVLQGPRVVAQEKQQDDAEQVNDADASHAPILVPWMSRSNCATPIGAEPELLRAQISSSSPADSSISPANDTL